MAKRPELSVNEEQIAFYMGIGRAVAQWAHVEHGLYLIAHRCFGSDDRGTLASGFYSIENFRSKLAFVDRAFATAPFVGEFQTEWDGARENARSLSSRRNEIVHGRVIGFLLAPPGRRLALVPLFGPKPKKKQREGLPPPGSLCVRDLDLASKQFSMASSKLMSLYSRIGGEKDLLAEHVQQEPKPLSLVQLRRQIDVMHPPRG